MQRNVILSLSAAIVGAIVLSANVAEANQKKPVKQPPKQCDQSVCVQHKVDANGRVSTTVTPKPGSRFNGGKPTTYTPARSKSLDKIGLQVPQGDRRPLPPFPGRRNQLASRIVDTVQECGDDVALPTDNGRVECVPAPKTEEKQASSQPSRYCDRVIKTLCRRGTIIRSLPPVWMTQVPDPSVPEGKDPGKIFPGLPPAPTNLISMASDFGFKPPAESRTPRSSVGSSSRFNPEPNEPPTTAGQGTSTR